MNGNLQEAIHLLKQLLNYLPRAQADIQQAAQQQDFQALLHHVHKLHGACCYCCAPALQQAAKNLECALRKQPVSTIPPLVLELEQAIERLVKMGINDKRLH